MPELRNGTPEEAGMDPARIERIRRRGSEWMARGDSLALVLLVARRGVICLHDAWGTLSPGPDAAPAQPDSVFMLSSLAKPVTAALALQLVEEGLLGLTRPVDYYIPELCGEGADAILVQHLLTHTSGIIQDQAEAFIAQRIAEGLDLPACPDEQHPAMHQILHALYPVQPAQPPGTAMSYAYQNYDLLGEVLRRVGGGAAQDLMRERIFEPLNMRDTALGLEERLEPRLVADFDGGLLPGLPVGEELRAMFALPRCGGSLFGPATDYARFAQMLLNGGHYGDERLLTRASVAQMTRDQIPGIGLDYLGLGFHTEASWSYGLDVTATERWPWYDGSLKPNGCYGHSGLGGSFFWVDPHNEIVAIQLSWYLNIDPDGGARWGDCDLFQNLVTAAVID